MPALQYVVEAASRVINSVCILAVTEEAQYDTVRGTGIVKRKR
jgi:hypothetical protein